MEIIVRRLSEREIEDYSVYAWPLWTKEISEFDWDYEATEDCLLLTGLVEVTNNKGEIITIQSGDYVTFPQGLTCRWKVIEPVKKHYRFR
ncbi:MAG: cupin [Candidatus Cloacimonetes bacterium HGW-Cloacimonetes-1]|nr:MAG: cupin [Candidatus Cloacimonetes bacterium HGW-Cloacimonetes-1]